MTERLFDAAAKAFESEELGKQHADGWGCWPTTVQEKVVGLLDGRVYDTILDLGCGPGNYALLLKGWSQYFAVDQSEAWLGIAKRRLGHQVAGVEFKRSWIEEYDHPGKVDLALCIDVFQHHAQPVALADKLVTFDAKFLCFNLMVTDKKRSEDFLWDDWGKLSEGMTPALADNLVVKMTNMMPGKLAGRVDLPYGDPLPQLTWRCYLLEKIG